jgi:hypothetical protein
VKVASAMFWPSATGRQQTVKRGTRMRALSPEPTLMHAGRTASAPCWRTQYRVRILWLASYGAPRTTASNPARAMRSPTRSTLGAWSTIQPRAASTSGIASRRTRTARALSPRPALISTAIRSLPRSSTRSISAPAAVRQKKACAPGCSSRSRRSTSSMTNPSQLAPREGWEASSSAVEMLSRWCSGPVSRR